MAGLYTNEQVSGESIHIVLLFCLLFCFMTYLLIRAQRIHDFRADAYIRKLKKRIYLSIYIDFYAMIIQMWFLNTCDKDV